jgi:hypothetical protein
MVALKPHTHQLWHVSVSHYLAKVGLEIARLLREKEVDETPQGDFPEEARQLARGKRVISRTTLRSIEANGNDLYLLHNKVGGLGSYGEQIEKELESPFKLFFSTIISL